MHRLSETKLYDPENGKKYVAMSGAKSLPKLIFHMILIRNITPQFGLPEDHFEKHLFFGGVFGVSC